MGFISFTFFVSLSHNPNCFKNFSVLGWHGNTIFPITQKASTILLSLINSSVLSALWTVAKYYSFGFRLNSSKTFDFCSAISIFSFKASTMTSPVRWTPLLIPSFSNSQQQFQLDKTTNQNNDRLILCLSHQAFSYHNFSSPLRYDQPGCAV